MYIDDIVWLDAIAEKLHAKHNVEREEVEEVLLNRPRLRWQEQGHRPGEDLYAAYGQANTGRYLTVFFVMMAGGSALIVSARDMDEKERRRYGHK